MVRGAGMGVGRKAAGAATSAASVYVHEKASEEADDNAAVNAVSAGELMTERAAVSLKHTQDRSKRADGKIYIPVLVDHSSYETNPLGRTEWVKLYGLLTGHEDQAEQAFDAEAKAFEQVSDQDATGKRWHFLYHDKWGSKRAKKCGLSAEND